MQNREKQIEEMVRIASKCITSWLNNETSKALPDYIAEALYNAGYRKQSEGEWVNNGMGRKVCSLCKGEMPYTKSGTVFATTYYQYRSKFCHNCGAKMKGGAE